MNRQEHETLDYIREVCESMLVLVGRLCEKLNAVEKDDLTDMDEEEDDQEPREYDGP